MNHRLLILLCAYCSIHSNAYALPEVIDNSVYPPSAMPANNANLAASPSTNALIEITARLEQLQAEVQQLTGKIEEQANQITELKKHQSSMYSDFDERIQHVENKDGGDSATQTSTDSTDTPSTDSGKPDAKPIDAQVPAAQAPETQAPETTVTDTAPTEKPAAAPKPDATPVTNAEAQEYQQAYNALRNGHTDQSIADFNAYLNKYPTGGLAGNAQYWLGEAYRVNRDNDAAKKAFDDVIVKYPGSLKVPDALLKLGYVEMDQKNPDKARDYFTRVTTDFPDSAAARLASKKLLLLNISN